MVVPRMNNSQSPRRPKAATIILGGVRIGLLLSCGVCLMMITESFKYLCIDCSDLMLPWGVEVVHDAVHDTNTAALQLFYVDTTNNTTADASSTQPPSPSGKEEISQQAIPRATNSTIRGSHLSPEPRMPSHPQNHHSAGAKLRIAMITFSHMNDLRRFDTLIFPSLETWLTRGTYFVVLIEKWRDAYGQLCQSKPEHCARLEPIFVDCPEGGFGESPCCKQEKSLIQINTDEWDWIAFFDDDMYFDMESVETYLNRFDPNKVMLVTVAGQAAKTLGKSGYLGRRSPYHCSSDPAYRYPWGQPVVYTRPALAMIQPGLRAGALVKQCLEFDVTHDAGNPIVHWMYQIPDMPTRFHMWPSDEMNSEVLAVHGITRFVPTCNRTFDMYDVHEQWLRRGKQKIKRYMMVVHDERWGFNQTETYAKYGHPSTWGDVWHTLPVSDCKDPIQKAANETTPPGRRRRNRAPA